MAYFPNPYAGYPNFYYNPTNPYQIQGPTQTYTRADSTTPNPAYVVQNPACCNHSFYNGGCSCGA